MLFSMSVTLASGLQLIFDADSEQHKLGADRLETLLAVPVNEQNRLKDIGPEQEIDVGQCWSHS